MSVTIPIDPTPAGATIAVGVILALVVMVAGLWVLHWLAKTTTLVSCHHCGGFGYVTDDEHGYSDCVECQGTGLLTKGD